MRIFIILINLCFISLISKGQEVSDCDSSYIYKHFLFYHPETNAFDDIDEPFIEEYWETQNEKARKYYFLSAFLKSIPVVQRVIMVSYLDKEKKIEAHNWIYNNLQTSNDTIRYFKVLDSGYGVPYSKLKIPEYVVKKYCVECSYK